MNILFLVFSFLAVLAVSTASFWQISSTVRLETSGYCGYLSANRGAENSLQKKLFRKLPNLSQPPPTIVASSSAKKASTFHSHRLRYPPHPSSRLELFALWQDESHPFVETTFYRLLHELYGHTTWFKHASGSGDVDGLIASLIRFRKAAEGTFLLHELFASLPQAQADLLYKMMKGTHTYSLEKPKSGYPPLFDFVSFSTGNIKQTCRFAFASLPLLRALFDEKTVNEIVSLEKEKWETDHRLHTCTKKELLAFLQHRPTSPTQPSMLDTYFHFSRHAPPSEKVFGQDPSTGIHTELLLKNK